MPIDFSALAGQMGSAFLHSIGRDYPNIHAYARIEFEHFAAWLRSLVEQSAAQQVSQEQAVLLLQMQRAAMRNVFLTIEGLGLLAVENAINAAINVARVAVNTAIHFTLL